MHLVYYMFSVHHEKSLDSVFFKVFKWSPINFVNLEIIWQSKVLFRNKSAQTLWLKSL